MAKKKKSDPELTYTESQLVEWQAKVAVGQMHHEECVRNMLGHIALQLDQLLIGQNALKDSIDDVEAAIQDGLAGE